MPVFSNVVQHYLSIYQCGAAEEKPKSASHETFLSVSVECVLHSATNALQADILSSCQQKHGC